MKLHIVDSDGLSNTMEGAILQRPLAPAPRLKKVTDFKDARLVWNRNIIKEIHRCTLSWLASQLFMLNQL